MPTPNRHYNFTDFPGHINKQGVYEFDELESRDSKGNTMLWTAYIRLVNVKHAKQHKVNWLTSEQKGVVPITADHLKPHATKSRMGKKSIPADICAQTWVVGGRAERALTTREPSYVYKGKNIGRSNESNPLTQAMIACRSKFLKKLDKGYRVRAQDEEKDPNKPKLYYMAAYKKYEEKPSNPRDRIVFPAYASVKLDGTNVTLRYHGGTIIMHSRTRKVFPPKPYVTQDAMKFMRRYSNVCICCEAYVDGLNLNEINGIMASSKESKHSITLHAYMIYVPKGVSPKCLGMTITPESTFAERVAYMNCMFKGTNMKHIKQIPQVVMNTPQEYDAFHSKAVADGYEGTVITNANSKAEIGEWGEGRTWQIRKRKPRYNSQFKITGYTQGDNGKAVGAIIMVMEAKKGVIFRADPENMTMDERRCVYSSMTTTKFNKSWKGKMATVTFHTLSDDGIPTQPKVTINHLVDE